MKLTTHERLILIEIFKSSKGLFLFTLHRQLKLAPKDLFTAIENLKSNGLVDVTEDRVKMTTEGMEYAVKTSLKTSTENNADNLIKNKFQGKSIKINEFYIPKNFEK